MKQNIQMKQTTFTLLLFSIIALVSCRKDKYDPTIKEYDDDQIKSYVSTNGITGMQRDTSGIYYKITDPGLTGSDIQYPDTISMVFTIRSIDGKYISSDTIANHYAGVAGHIYGTVSPLGLNVPGLQSAIHDILKHPGGIMRVIIPSHLAYGVSGAGSGSSTITTNRIAGNQSLDYYVHIIGNRRADATHPSDQEAYDQMVIKNYIGTNGLTTMKQDPEYGYWYSIGVPGTGTVPITDNSTVSVTYTTELLNGTIADQYNVDGPGQPFDIPDLIKGVQFSLKKYATTGTLMTVLIPSHLAYGNIASSIPPNSCVRYDVRVLAVAP